MPLVKQYQRRSSGIWGQVAGLVLSILIGSECLWPSPAFAEALPERHLLKGHWEYVIPVEGKEAGGLERLPSKISSWDWKPIEKPCFNQKGKNPESVWFRVELPKPSGENQSIYIRSMEKPFRAFYGESQIYANLCGTKYNFWVSIGICSTFRSFKRETFFIS